jgi:hypothetical protein
VTQRFIYLSSLFTAISSLVRFPFTLSPSTIIFQPADIIIVMRYAFFATSTLLYATLLGPAFYYLWIYAGSGNANFFYAITLVWSLAVTVIVTDALFAVLRDEWETERPEMRGKDVIRI